MEQAMTVPMSMASVGYALFALQQSVPTSELKPIRFNLANGGVATAGFVPEMGAVSTMIADGAEADGHMAAPDGEAVAVHDGSGAAAPAHSGGVNSTGMFGGSLPGALAFVSPEDMPEADADGQQESEPTPEPAPAAVPHDAPRAAQQIGLLRELSFLDS